MINYTVKNIILSIMAAVGVATTAVACGWLMHYYGVHDGAAVLLSLIAFIGLAIPIPFHLVSVLASIKSSQTDGLTGLFNRTTFNLKFKAMLAECVETDKKFHILILDLNKFKQVNDTLGHHVGDLLLKHIATQLLQAVRGTDDIVARLGGDEFAILVSDFDNVNAYEPVITKIVKAVNAPVKIDGHYLYIGVSIGVATYPDSGVTSVNLMRFADIAMYSAKKMQKDFCVYKEDDNTNKVVDLTILGEIRKSIEDDDFELWFQPKKNLATKGIDSVECLVRWNHPIRGLIGPEQFIPFAEESGMIKYLTQFVIKNATQSYKRLKESGYDLDISVNVSPNDIADPSTMTTIIKSIVKADMLPEKFVLEVTETAIMHDPDSAFKVLVALESLGIKLSIDDFGTGHSSMTYLKNFPIHEVKIDQSFVRELETSRESFNIVKSTIELSHSLGAITVGEGVETAKIEDMLATLNCDYVQGYYIAKPMPIDQLIIWLNTCKEELSND